MSDDVKEVRLGSLDPNGYLPADLRAQVVPQGLLGDNWCTTVEKLNFPNDTEVAVFATVGPNCRLGIVLSTGEVVVAVSNSDRLRHGSPSVEEFTGAARALERWYQGLALPPSEDVDAIRQHLTTVYPESMRADDGFWYTTVDDIEIGDYDE